MSSPNYYLGCISGTSIDGLDIALIDYRDGTAIHIVADHTEPLPDALREDLLRLGNPSDGELDISGHCDAALGRFIGEALVAWLARIDVSADDIQAIGSHGQTVRHRPDLDQKTQRPGFTLQIGDPNQIAEITGITTVADFRRRDMAAGGQGAPLVPPFHRALFSQDEETNRVILNIGGIANLSLLEASISGFDTGPGNGLMDLWCQRHLQQAFDQNGQWAASGNVSEALLSNMLSDGYFARPAPKSTGREYFNARWLDAKLAQFQELAAADVQATLCELTARSILTALPRQAQHHAIVVCGGGRLNWHLMARLGTLHQAQVVASESLGVNGDAIEAAAFAWLAAQTLTARPGNAPTVTGASGERILGAIYQA